MIMMMMMDWTTGGPEPDRPDWTPVVQNRTNVPLSCWSLRLVA